MQDFVTLKSLCGTFIYSALGMLIFFAGFWIFDRMTPYQLWKEVIEKKNSALAILLGLAEASPMIDRRLVRSCTVRFDVTPTVRAALDGELVRLKNPIAFRCFPNSLRIRRAAPPSPAADPEAG